MTNPPANIPLLSVTDLTVAIDTEDGTIIAAEDVSFSLAAGSCLGLVGESGCGKSMTALAIMGLLPAGSGRIVRGSVAFEGHELIGLPEHEMRRVRGGSIAMIFQEPMTSLNPAFTVGDQIVEALRTHEKLSHKAARGRALDLLRQVRIPAPEDRLDEYPHRLSGGMRQRIMIAIALVCRPKLVIADEPTTALDVTIQAQILDLLRLLRDETGTAIILISHNLGVVAELADHVCVMYAGSVVESAPVDRLFNHPEHPYTIGLLGAIPHLEAPNGRLVAIEGTVPDALARPAGCRFDRRCPFALPRCATEMPTLAAMAPAHLSACWAAPLL